MGSLYSGTSVSGYNSNPPPDDGSTGSLNQLQWNRDIKGKIGDPLNTFAAAASSALVTSFGKTISGGSVVKTAVNYGASAADQGRNIVATASGITITTPDATSVLSPFVWCINNQSTGTITVAGFSSQNIDGANTATLGAARGILLWTDGTNWFSSGLVMGNLPLVNPPFGFDAPFNLQLNATVGSNLLTVAVKANNGADPSTSNPVLIPFRDTVAGGGDPVWVAITSALSINTNATGATLGSINSTPFRFWVVAFNNAGTVVLALFNAVNATTNAYQLFSINESSTASTTGISAAATSAGVFYTPNGTTLSSKAFRIIGYVEYQNGLTTAGTYASSPSTVQLFGPGVKKPGDVIQAGMSFTVNSTSSTTSSFSSSNLTLSFSPSYACSLVRIRTVGGMTVGAGNGGGLLQMFRGSTGIGIQTEFLNNNAQSNGYPFSTMDLDYPGTISSTTYTLKFSSDGSHTVSVPIGNGSNIGGRIEFDEIMG